MDKIVDFLKKHWQIIVIAVLSVVLILEIWQLFRPLNAAVDAVKITDWGLSFQGEEGDPPVAGVTASDLAPYGAYYIGDTTTPVLYLTFDAGYENGYAVEMLDTLKKNNVQATFFLTGNYFKTSPEIVKRMVEDGHTVGNHTLTHPDINKFKNIADLRVELEEVERLYYATTGHSMTKLYRPPQGKFSFDNLAQAQMLGYKTVFWSLAYADWDNNAQPNPDASLNKLFSRVHNGAVILLHLTSETNAAILDRFITGCRERGYEFHPLTELTGT